MQIAKIIPLKRLPRGLDVFDYAIPEELATDLAIGQLVHIPFRTSTLFGIVSGMNNEQLTINNKDTIKPIINLVNKTPFLSKQHLSFLHAINRMYGISFATAATMMMPPLQKRKIGKVEIKGLKDQKIKRSEDRKIIFKLYSSEAEHEEAFTTSLKGSTLIVVPEVYHIQEVFDLLPKKKQEQTLIWHSKLSVKEQFERWVEVRNGKKKIILGTRGAVFLPFTKLDSIIIDFEHDENLKHWDQAPRFHVKDVTRILAKMYGAEITLMSFSPSCESYFHVHKGNYDSSHPLSHFVSAPPRAGGSPTIVSMSHERHGGNYNVLSQSVLDAMEDTVEISKDVFLFINRKGYATSVGCNDCGHIELCPDTGLPLVYHEDTNTLKSAYTKFEKPMILVCPKCSSPLVQLRGMGTEQVENSVRTLYANNNNVIIERMDSEEHNQVENTDVARIVIGTEAAFSKIRWGRTGMIAFLDADRQLAIPEFNASEHLWHLIQEALYRKNEDANVYIQTSKPDHVLFRSLAEPDRFYRTDLNFRRALGYPPYNYLVRYFYGDQNQLNAKKTAEALYHALTRELKSSIIHPPLEMHPRYYRGQYWYLIMVKLDAKKWYTELTALNKFIPSTWKVDPNPISLLSP